MKVFYVLSCILLLGCSQEKKEQKDKGSPEQHCFELKEGINNDDRMKKYVPPTNEQILKALPTHIHQQQLKNFTPFHYDKATVQKLAAEEKAYFASNAYQQKYSEWIAALPEFNYVSVNDNYALAKNRYGFWVVEKTEQSYKPYFLGFTQSFYLNEEYAKDQKFYRDGQFVFTGAVVHTERLSSVPVLPQYELLKDGVQFSVSLADLKKDSDGDGFNDVFEEFIGLNPKSADTDNDGIKDFEDLNPRFASVQSDLANMYNSIADEPAAKMNYSFTEILTNCDYFQQINPKNRKVLIYTVDDKAPIKNDVLDVFFPRKYSKILKYPNYPTINFIDFADETGNGTITAEKVNGVWDIKKKFTVTFGM